MWSKNLPRSVQETSVWVTQAPSTTVDDCFHHLLRHAHQRILSPTGYNERPCKMNVTTKLLAHSEPRLQFHPEYETHVVMMLQKLDKVERTKRVLAFSLNRTDRDDRDLAWWSDRTRSRRRFVGLFRLHFPLPQPVANRCSHRLPEDRVFRIERHSSSNQNMRNPSVELLQGSTRAPLSCWRDFAFAPPFPRTTSSVALRPLLTTPEVYFVDTILSSYHRFQAQWRS